MPSSGMIRVCIFALAMVSASSDFYVLTISANPILNLQTGYALKRSFVVGHYCKGGRFRVGSDPQIVVTDRRP